MPPNPNSKQAEDTNNGADVICIADQFHFSSFYSSTNLAGLDDDDSVTNPNINHTPTHSRRPSRSDSMSIVGPEEQVHGDARLKPHTIANPDRVKLKFYSNVLGDNSTFIHYVSLFSGIVVPVLCIVHMRCVRGDVSVSYNRI